MARPGPQVRPRPHLTARGRPQETRAPLDNVSESVFGTDPAFELRVGKLIGIEPEPQFW